jgi:hypothetical protein
LNTRNYSNYTVWFGVKKFLIIQYNLFSCYLHYNLIELWHVGYVHFFLKEELFKWGSWRNINKWKITTINTLKLVKIKQKKPKSKESREACVRFDVKGVKNEREICCIFNEIFDIGFGKNWRHLGCASPGYSNGRSR